MVSEWLVSPVTLALVIQYSTVRGVTWLRSSFVTLMTYLVSPMTTEVVPSARPWKVMVVEASVPGTSRRV